MNLSSTLFTSRVSCASVYQTVSVAALCCPACSFPQEDNRQVLQPCKHLACVYDQEAQHCTFKSDDFKQRLAVSKTSPSDELDGRTLSKLGYSDEM